MSKLFYCLGNKCEKPYRIPGTGIAISTIEELCFYICHYTETIDRDFMKDELADFMEEIGMEGAQLKQMVHFGGSLAGFCQMILEQSANQPSSSEWQTIKDMLTENEKMTRHARMKKQADLCLGEMEYMKAVQYYGRLLQVLKEEEEDIRPDVLLGMGKAYVGLFYFDLAAQCFEKSYELSKEDKALTYFLLCKRMSLSKSQYVDFVAKNSQYYNKTLEVESFYETCRKETDQAAMQMMERPDAEALLQQFRKMVG